MPSRTFSRLTVSVYLVGFIYLQSVCVPMCCASECVYLCLHLSCWLSNKEKKWNHQYTQQRVVRGSRANFMQIAFYFCLSTCLSRSLTYSLPFFLWVERVFICMYVPNLLELLSNQSWGPEHNEPHKPTHTHTFSARNMLIIQLSNKLAVFFLLLFPVIHRINVCVFIYVDFVWLKNICHLRPLTSPPSRYHRCRHRRRQKQIFTELNRLSSYFNQSGSPNLIFSELHSGKLFQKKKQQGTRMGYLWNCMRVQSKKNTTLSHNKPNVVKVDSSLTPVANADQFTAPKHTISSK